MCARVFYNEDIGDNIFEKALILTRVSAPKVTCSSGEGIANPQTMRASFGEPQPLRMTRAIVEDVSNDTLLSRSDSSLTLWNDSAIGTHSLIRRFYPRASPTRAWGRNASHSSARYVCLRQTRYTKVRYARTSRAICPSGEKASSDVVASLGLMLKRPTNQYKY